MRQVIVIGILLLATAVMAAPSFEWDGSRPVPSVPYSWAPDGVRNPTNVAVFRDNLPWGSSTDTDILTAHSIAHTVFGSGSLGNVDLSPFDKVIISNQQEASFCNAVAANAAWLEAYADAGGVVLLGMAHYFPGYMPLNTNYGGGYELVLEAGNNTVVIVDPGHEVFNIPNVISSAEMQNWNYSSHGDLNMPTGSMMLVLNGDATSGPALSEMPYGNGWFIATTHTYQWAGASYNFAENLVLYLPEASWPPRPSP